jgi:hypothetical protein
VKKERQPVDGGKEEREKGGGRKKDGKLGVLIRARLTDPVEMSLTR